MSSVTPQTPSPTPKEERKPEQTIVQDIEESLGSRATKLANVKATQWLEDAWSVITRRVLDTAQRGLFRCALRFEDVIPLDPENQNRLLKLLEKQNLKGTWKTLPEGVQLDILWGNDHL